MRFGPFTIARTKSLPALRPLSGNSGGWWPVIRESFTGAWQRNAEIRPQDVTANSAVYACVSLIAADIKKLCFRLVKEDADGVWTEADDSSAFSPVIRKPNRYQTRQKFIEQWILSKLLRGNAYILKQRDNRGSPGKGVVTGLYVLDPSRVTPLVTPVGDVYYEIRRDDLSEVTEERLTVPASEIIHDIMCPLWHPLIGVSPIYASGNAALQGLAIQANSKSFFENGSNPSGMLSAPKEIEKSTAERLKAQWEEATTGVNSGRMVVAGDGIAYQQFTMSAVDAQLIEQLKWTAEDVCRCFHVPAYMIGVGSPPPYANYEPLVQSYHAQCIQSLTTDFESCWDDGCELPKPYGTEFDINDLYWMDLAARTKAAGDGIRSGLTVNEIRKACYGYPRVDGGDVVLMQEQNHSLEALAALDQAKIRAAEAPPQAPQLSPADANAQPDPATTNAASFEIELRKEMRLVA